MTSIFSLMLLKSHSSYLLQIIITTALVLENLEADIVLNEITKKISAKSLLIVSVELIYNSVESRFFVLT